MKKFTTNPYNEKVRKKMYLGILSTPEEVTGIKLLDLKEKCAIASLNPFTIPKKEVENKKSDERVTVFVDSLVQIIAECRYLKENWWVEINSKYPDLTNHKDVFIDFSTGEFFVYKYEKKEQ